MKTLITLLAKAMALALALSPASYAEENVKAKAFLAATMTVYKSPSCGCCGKWVDHMQAAGFEMKVEHVQALDAVKNQFRVPQQLRSCHTASNDGYVFEGHIPVDVIKKFLDEHPKDAYGLAVPGMPIGSPGMEMGNRKDTYQVIALKKDGKHEIYATINGKQ